MFADLSLRGSQRTAFERTLGLDYEPEYIAIDDGAMSWNFSETDTFVERLGYRDALTTSQRFITLMGRTSRSLERTALVVAGPGRRRQGVSADVLQDLAHLWDAYEQHMTSLFTFWNVEELLSGALVDKLRERGMQHEIDAGLPSYIRPSETNWFALEQRNLAVLKSRFGNAPDSGLLATAASDHAALFGFLLAPFNLGSLPTADDVLPRIRDLAETSSLEPVGIEPGQEDFDAELSRLGELERELSFWKTERLDAFARADALARPVFEDAAAILGLGLERVFAHTRQELTDALSENGRVNDAVLDQRLARFCLALVNGSIDFYEPSEARADHAAGLASSGQVLKGRATSPGRVTGRVRLVKPGEQPQLESDEILVTTMTRPDMGVALDQALAYVTDEGGRLSHAAIVSREKGKPCVTALETATQLLRPGMIIEVDGTNGTVTVIDASFLDG